ncbi:MAG: polysaccharide deacetylase family protein [Armatimonadetes bacterium]|nr:polysaccharide deacetylase family protein [Armatimonadota bacterium]
MPQLRRLILLLLPVLSLALVAGCGCRRGATQGKEAAAPKAPLPYRFTHVLCYHHLADTPKSVYDVKPADFRAQLQVLKDGGYQSINCKQLADYLANVQDIPEKSVIISFDDGRASVLKVARPLLDQFGYQAVLFINPGSVGGKGFLTWDDLKVLAQAGYEIDSHTTTHLNLTRKLKKLTLEEFQEKVHDELADSYTKIEEELGQAPVAMAYPFGNYDEYVMRTTKESGYLLGLSIDPGAIDSQSDAYALPRKMVVDGTSLKTFQRNLDTQPLHLTGREPSLGARVTSRAYSFTAQLGDADAAASLAAEGGRGAKIKYDATTQAVKFTSRLNRGANLVRLHSTGTPRREAAWIVVCDVTE